MRPGWTSTAEVPGQAGWAALPGKFGYTKLADGPEPEVRFVKSAPEPEPLTMDEIHRRELAARKALDAYVPVPLDDDGAASEC